MEMMFNEQIEQEIKEFAKENDTYVEYLYFYVFPQGWGSSALGYRGIGGQVITSSHTIVIADIMNTGNVMISYGGRFIKLNNPNQEFWSDVIKYQRLEPEYKLGKYKRED